MGGLVPDLWATSIGIDECNTLPSVLTIELPFEKKLMLVTADTDYSRTCVDAEVATAAQQF